MRRLDLERAAARLDPQELAVAVEVRALAGLRGRAVEELPEVRLAGRELVVDDGVAGRHEDLRLAAAEAAELEQQPAQVGGPLREHRRRGVEVVDDAAELVLLDELVGLVAARAFPPRIVAGSSLTLGVSSRAKARSGGKAALITGSWSCACSTVGASCASVSWRLLRLGGESAGRDREVRDQVAELALAARELLEDAAARLDQAPQVAGLLAEQRLADLRGALAGPCRRSRSSC